MKDSLYKLSLMFPYFLNKVEDSNFMRNNRVLNSEFQEAYNRLFLIYVGYHLDHGVFIQRIQNESNHQYINFLVYINNIQKIIIYESSNNIEEPFKEIHSVDFKYEDNQKEYTFNYETIDSENIIPDKKYKIQVETYNEEKIIKGYPENDTLLGDEFDHDQTLDIIGSLANIPRKEYQPPETELYPLTEPPYNNKTTEDDYYYKERIKKYLQEYHEKPAPLLELWKLFGVEDSTIQNREYRLCKMFEESLHSEGWSPLDWEHKDPQCVLDDESYFLFVTVDNDSPFRGQQVRFTLQVLNSRGGNVTGDFLFLPFLDGERVGEEIIDSYVFTVDTSDLDMTQENVFRFKGFSSMAELENDLLEHDGLFVEDGLFSDEIIITVKGCNDGDYYVALDGDDSNSGSKEYPFKTIEHAFSVVQPNEVIVLVDGVYDLNSTVIIPCSCTLVSCAEDSTMINSVNATVFQVLQGVQFNLINIGLKYKCCELFSDNTLFWNDNPTNNHINISFNRLVGCKPFTRMTVTAEAVVAGETSNITGSIVAIDRVTGEETPLPDAEIKLLLDGTPLNPVTTNEDGVFAATAIVNGVGGHTVEAEYLETTTHCGSKAECTLRAYGETYMSIDDEGNLKYTTNYNTLSITYDEATSDLDMSYDDEECSIDITINDDGEIIVEDK